LPAARVVFFFAGPFAEEDFEEDFPLAAFFFSDLEAPAVPPRAPRPDLEAVPLRADRFFEVFAGRGFLVAMRLTRARETRIATYK